MGDSGVPTATEAEGAVTWLRRRRVHVAEPTRLLAIRIGAHADVGGWLRYFGRSVLYLIAGVVCVVAFGSIWRSAGARDEELFGSGNPVWFIFLAQQLAMWRHTRVLERKIAARLAAQVAPHAPQSRLELVGGWYWAAAVLTFGGGAALAVALLVTTPDARYYGWSWLTVLALFALCWVVMLASVLRLPVIAEDEASLAVDRRLWLGFLGVTAPTYATFPVVLDLLFGHRLPSPFTWWQLGYVVLVIGTEAVGLTLGWWRFRTLPPGNYGAAAPVGQESEIGWSPPV